MAGFCFTARDLLRVRIARLTEAGSPVSGASNGYVIDSAVQLVATPTYDAGQTFTQRKGDGSICAAFKDNNEPTGSDVTLQICKWDTQFLALATCGQVMPPTGSPIIGHRARQTDEPIYPVSLEWWTYNQDGKTLADNFQYRWFVIPYVKLTLGAETFEHGLTVVNLTGVGSENDNITSNGPFDDWPTGVAQVDGITSAYGEWVTNTLPASACAYVSVSSAAS